MAKREKDIMQYYVCTHMCVVWAWLYIIFVKKKFLHWSIRLNNLLFLSENVPKMSENPHWLHPPFFSFARSVDVVGAVVLSLFTKYSSLEWGGRGIRWHNYVTKNARFRGKRFILMACFLTVNVIFKTKKKYNIKSKIPLFCSDFLYWSFEYLISGIKRIKN